MKRLLLIALLAALTVPFARMVFDLATTGRQHEVGISTSQLNPKPKTQYFEMK